MTPSKGSPAPGSTELQPPRSPLSNTNRKQSAGLPGHKRSRMSTLSKKDEMETKTFVWWIDVFGFLFLPTQSCCGSVPFHYFLRSFHLSFPLHLPSPISQSAISPVPSSSRMSSPAPISSITSFFSDLFDQSLPMGGSIGCEDETKKSNRPFEARLTASLKKSGA